MRINRQAIKEILPYLFGVILMFMIAYQLIQDSQFIKKGPRFTAYDGQELCERVKRLESESYGFKDSNLQQLPCNYAAADQQKETKE